ncbi:hypothetical protein FB565_003104 [Actinoplanes lutulentus]|uniref:Glycosyl hydrolase family 2 n=1 Tax=Actinoplanes lutulentus TaxID=1287878 RepID=A0A327Z4V5_9ACTN|nr:glycoside hydrolase family 2 TIM barrel-domain containing protein [Actinoplanes lutulentus]MBB2943391.1 hypothetical protein [Actinoplanes lutulentus]RAK28449.1 glycosyl hydrolase family 2 [Actinoplanes lutulentus]
MTTTTFNDGWQFGREGDDEYTTVDLPHDAMIHETRRADAPAWAHGAYFPGGGYRYRKSWTAPTDLDGKQISLFFEGVYRHSRVLLDGHDIGGSLSGYAEFEVRLDPYLRPGAQHLIEVTVDNAVTPNSRWYTGSGIYRPVWLDVRDTVHIDRDGVTFQTIDTAADAHAIVQVRLVNPKGEPLDVTVVLSRDGAEVTSASASTSGHDAALPLTVTSPELWSAENPARYDLEVLVSRAQETLDRRTLRVGLRTIDLDATHGLRINGTPVLLRGANVHHDSGVLGAATFAAAELRRVRILKENGYNAIRSAHNPAARALLDACDELGMYVMDELFDGWYDHKTDHDDAEHFDPTWRREAAALVAKDRNRPSVLMYSIGNENGEALTPRGRLVAAELAAELHTLDPTRAVTIGVNMVAATFAGLAGSGKQEEPAAAAKAAPDMTSTTLNVISNRFGMLAKVFPRLRAADRATRELFEHVDVAGYNYGTPRYPIDAKLHPRRVMVGTESMPGDIARIWPLVEQLPALIGDFMWAGWDYLGEAGGGSWIYGTRRAPYLKAYPQLTSGTGAIDITGEPGAPILLARAAWGLLTEPAIAVRPLDVPAGPVARTTWRSTDAVPSWSWYGHGGRPAEVEVYTADDEIELLVNGRSIGRRPAGGKYGFVARFRTPYRPGTIEAVAYRAGRETGRSSLRSAGPVRLRVVAETQRLAAAVQELAFLRLELADDEGVVDSAVADLITVQVEGPATLAGFGSGATATEESFTDAEHTTFRGRALAVIRAGGSPGHIRVTATSRNHGTAVANIEVTD